MRVFPLLLAGLIQAVLGQPQWRVIHSSGQITAGWGEPALVAEVASGPPARSVWLWSWRHAPIAIAPGSVTGATRKVAGDGPAWLEVRLPRRKPTADARVIAAPAEMWRELPESELPSWPAPVSGRLAVPIDGRQPWRVRLVSEGEGSWWADVPASQRSVSLPAVPAPGVGITVLQPDGKPPEKVHVSITEATVRQGASRTWALLAGRAGRVAADGLPDEREITLNVLAAGFPPLTVRGWPSRLPRQIVLQPGAEVTGRITDPSRKGIAGARVEAEAWMPQAPRLLRLGDKTREDGSFELRGLPAGRLNLTLRTPGFAPVVESLDLAVGERREIGVRVLEPGRTLEVYVTDERDEPVPEAAVEAGPGLTARADAEGRAELAGVPNAPLELRGTAFGYLPGTSRLQPPLPPYGRLILRRGFIVRGRLLDASGAPVSSGTVRLEAPGCSSEGTLRTDGTFEEEFQPGKEGHAVLRSPRTRELRVPLVTGESGGVVDLGDLTAPASPEVTGRIVGVRGAPVAGARIWLPRPGPEGPTMAWASNDLVEATSGEDGRFHLSGLAPGPATLRVEAASYARATRDVTVPAAEADQGVDVGTIALDGGSLVRIHVAPSRHGAEPRGDLLARVDLRRQWLAADMLNAQVWNGEAQVPNVPPGAARVSVAAGRKILCEQEIEVPAGGEIDVDCVPGALLVTGRVLVGDVAAGSGTLIWHSSQNEGWSRVDTQVSPSGLRQQQAFAAGRPQVDVPVEPDGTFRTRDLTPGPWRVSFVPQQGSATPQIELGIPPGERFDAVLPFAGHNVAGVVVTQDGSPAAGAQVTELASGAFAIARADGSFVLTGLQPGKVAVQARQNDLASSVTPLELSAERPPEPVRLVVQKQDPPRVAVTVLDRSGAPAAGAMVFFEEEGKGIRLLVTGTDGRALAGIEAPLPPRVRAGAFAGGGFVLGDWIGLEPARQGMTLQHGETGGLEVRSASGNGAVRVVSPGGWEVSWLMRLLGISSETSPEQPLRLEGLPAGAYTVTLGPSAATANVAEGGFSEVILP